VTKQQTFVDQGGDGWRADDLDGNWWQTCPHCGLDAACRLRPDTIHYADMWCGACRTHRWLKTPRIMIMSTDVQNSVPTPAIDNPWEIPVTTGGGGDYELCPAGNYPGTIIALIDAGFHDAQNQKDGSTYQRRILIIAFEITKRNKDGKPFVLADRQTWSMSNNSNFYALVTNLTGPKKEGERFDPRVLAGMPVMVQVTNNTVQDRKGKDKVYHNIGTVAQFPEGLPFPTPSRPPLIWSVMEGKPVPDVSWLPYVYGETVAGIIASSHEYKAGRVPQSRPEPAAATADGNDIPF
jgi:hypothetical protein